jgi:hypothetical protein
VAADDLESASREPTMEEIERAWRRPRSDIKPTGWRRQYYAINAYCALVFSYVWRGVGVVIIVWNSWTSLRDPALRREWMPLWMSALVLTAVLVIGHFIGRLASWGILRITGRAPWSGNS